MIGLETLEVWLRALAMMAGRLEPTSLDAEANLLLRKYIDDALVLVLEAKDEGGGKGGATDAGNRESIGALYAEMWLATDPGLHQSKIDAAPANQGPNPYPPNMGFLWVKVRR